MSRAELVPPGNLFKIYSAPQWRTSQSRGELVPAPVDEADGFVHLSVAGQVRGTANKWFAGQPGLILLELDRAAVEAADLRWEPARGGELFPHVYGRIELSAVVKASPLSGDDGAFAFPPELPEA